MDSLKLSPRNQAAVAAAVIVLIAVVGVVVLLVPKWQAINAIKTQIVQAQQEKAAAQTLLKQRQDAKGAAAQTQADLIAIENAMPEDPQLPSLIVELQDAANEAGLDFLKLTPTKPEVRTGYSAVKVDLELQGRWTDSMEFLRQLGELTRQVRVLKVSIKPSDTVASPSAETTTTTTKKKNESPKLSTTVSLEAYVMSGASGTAVPGAPAGQ
jgi:type IV pilus assembly protein PilO